MPGYIVEARVQYGDKVDVFSLVRRVRESEYSVDKLDEIRREAKNTYYGLAGIQLPQDKAQVHVTLRVTEVDAQVYDGWPTVVHHHHPALDPGGSLGQ